MNVNYKMMMAPLTEDQAKALCNPSEQPIKDAHAWYFEAKLEDKLLFCVQCGVEMDPTSGEPYFTTYGRIALEAAIREIGKENIEEILLVQLVKGPTPTEEKMHNAFSQASDKTLVVFVGDFAKTMDGEIAKVLMLNMADFAVLSPLKDED